MHEYRRFGCSSGSLYTSIDLIFPLSIIKQFPSFLDENLMLIYNGNKNHDLWSKIKLVYLVKQMIDCKETKPENTKVDKIDLLEKIFGFLTTGLVVKLSLIVYWVIHCIHFDVVEWYTCYLDRVGWSILGNRHYCCIE